MYKVNICSAIVILETNMTGQVLTRTGSIYNEFFFSSLSRCSFFKSQDGSSTVCIVNHMISSAIWNK